jgi:hypothetical protein
MSKNFWNAGLTGTDLRMIVPRVLIVGGAAGMTPVNDVKASLMVAGAALVVATVAGNVIAGGADRVL